MRLPRVQSIINMQIWPEHVLLLVNSAANLLAIAGAAIVLVALVFLYFTGVELHKTNRTGRAVRGRRPSRKLRLRVSQLQFELKTARRSEEAIALRVSKAEADLAAVRRADERKKRAFPNSRRTWPRPRRQPSKKNSRIAQLETNLATARAANEKNNSRIAELEASLNAEQTATKQKDSRIASSKPIWPPPMHPTKRTTPSLPNWKPNFTRNGRRTNKKIPVSASLNLPGIGQEIRRGSEGSGKKTGGKRRAPHDRPGTTKPVSRSRKWNAQRQSNRLGNFL